MAYQMTVILLDPDGVKTTLETDDDHVNLSDAGLTYNDGLDTVYYFQPWARILRIVTTPSTPVYP